MAGNVRLRFLYDVPVVSQDKYNLSSGKVIKIIAAKFYSFPI